MNIDIFSLHQGDTGHTKLPYSLPLKHSQWTHEGLEMLEKVGTISRSVSLA